VDRVNTTMAVWMGTTMACAQCHDHKYDPLTQQEYFRLFAILNNTEDADRADESPFLSIYTPEQKAQRRQWEEQAAPLETITQTATPALTETQAQWEKTFATEVEWRTVKPRVMQSKAGARMTQDDDGVIRVERGDKTDVYTLEAPWSENGTVSALRLEALPDDSLPGKGPGHDEGNFVISRVLATLGPSDGQGLSGRYLRIEIPGKEKVLSLAEVQVFKGTENIALQGQATQSSTTNNGPAKLAIDGNTNGNYDDAKSTTHTETSENPWWELDLKATEAIDRIVLWNRTDGGLKERLSHFQLAVLNEEHEPVWQQHVEKAPDPRAEFSLSGARAIDFAGVYADYSDKDFDLASLLESQDAKNPGWSVAPEFGKAHALTLLPKAPIAAPTGSKFTLRIEQLSKHEHATLGKLRLSTAVDARAPEFARTPSAILQIVHTPAEQRTESQARQLSKYYLSIAPALQPVRDQLAALKKKLRDMKPYTTVPVMRELAGDKRRKTHVQRRGNFLDLGKEVTEGLPAAFPALPEGAAADRLALARWLISENNPLTPRVVVNRFWESLFGIGIVQTSEEFGAQGELPSHPELLDWLASELVQRKWDLKSLLKLMVTSATYCQSSRVTPELFARDPDNRLLARGPRLRLSAEMIRDQALAVSGLLAHKVYGPPVKPPQPKLGLSAAFGSGIDWEPSAGEDRYRRALYTTWRRSNPYPSMATFDAPNREVCTVRRERSNTPLQALVTLNDPVYFEAAQALGRRMASTGSTPADKVRQGFRLCLARPPTAKELDGLVRLYQMAYQRFTAETDKARAVATKPIGAAPAGAELADLAAWTVVGNVLLNLDEMLMKR
ncbi:MAG TPA: DUF1553 domain-containing protein, partial [Candidatus Binatia bacterium]|nr:DUF1553 domain-containing protein [Candidatus Binatia bacterium]